VRWRGGRALLVARGTLSHEQPAALPLIAARPHGGGAVHAAAPNSGSGCRILATVGEGAGAGVGGPGVAEEIHLETVVLRPTVLKGLVR
jgi:hypothetical protein